MAGEVPVQTRGIHFLTVPVPAQVPPGGAIVNIGATVQPTAFASVTPVTTPLATVAVAVGRVVQVHPVTVTVGAEV